MRGKKLVIFPYNIKEWWLKNHAIYQHNEWTFHENKEVEPVQQVQMKIYHSNTYRKDFSWSHFDDELGVQQRLSVESTALHNRFCSLSNISNSLSINIQEILFHKKLFSLLGFKCCSEYLGNGTLTKEFQSHYGFQSH